MAVPAAASLALLLPDEECLLYHLTCRAATCALPATHCLRLLLNTTATGRWDSGLRLPAYVLDWRRRSFWRFLAGT
jgi:hypothetical protein